MPVAVRDNSLSDLSFDFLGGVQHVRETPAPAKAAESDLVPETAPAPADPEAAQAPPAETAGIVSAPRRHAWGFFYLLRTVIVILVVFLVGSLVLTMLLNPSLTFDDAVRLLLERAADLVERIRGFFE